MPFFKEQNSLQHFTYSLYTYLMDPTYIVQLISDVFYISFASNKLFFVKAYVYENMITMF